ncbi:MAG: DEAD/DEAH box helicase [Thermoplasmata archaeon]
MRLSELDIDPRVRRIIEDQGITELYPPQEKAIGPALAGENLVLAIPTASGKSLIAYLALLKAVLNGGKALYIVPLRALATEKYDDLKRFEELGIRVALSMGDYDSDEPTLVSYDVIIATSEKADSLLRHRTHWLKQLSVVVADEVHLINDPGRGPTLEVTLAKLRQVNPRAQVIALSATIANSAELAGWLEARHIVSDWRPVPLKEGVYFDGGITWSDLSHHLIVPDGDDIPALVRDTLREGGQCLLFVNTRASTETLARKLRPAVQPYLHRDEVALLSKQAASMTGRQEEPTSLANRLARNLKAGSAFHNAGLTNPQRKTVEDLFREGALKVIVATPSLAMGLNLPARRVIIRDVRRYEPNYGYNFIPVLEVKQMAGRAGRPQYDEFGEAILLARYEEDISELMDNYILAGPEAIESKLGSEPALRMHLLAAIATGHVQTETELRAFMERTFYAYQRDVALMEEAIESVLRFLEEEEMTRREETLKPTLFGRRTSDLYVDPLSAVVLRDALKSETAGENFSYLHAVAATPDMPTLYLGRKDYAWVEEKAATEAYFIEPDDEEFLLSEVKTASLLEDWMEEVPEDDITKKFRVGPGDIRRMVQMGEWLLYAMHELGRLFNKKRLRPLARLMARMGYGVKEELLDLVSLRGVGRVRARALFRRGIKTKEDIRTMEINELARIPTIGPGIAKGILAQLGRKEEVEEGPREGQYGLYDFD